MLGTGRKESRKKGKETTGELFFTLSFMWYLPWGPQKFFHDIIGRPIFPYIPIYLVRLCLIFLEIPKVSFFG